MHVYATLNKCICFFLSVCIYVCLYIYIYIYIYIYACVCARARVYVYACLCPCVYVYSHMYIYICIHICVCMLLSEWLSRVCFIDVIKVKYLLSTDRDFHTQSRVSARERLGQQFDLKLINHISERRQRQTVPSFERWLKMTDDDESVIQVISFPGLVFINNSDDNNEILLKKRDELRRAKSFD